MNLNNFLAKENETIYEHNQELHKCAETLKKNGYLNDKEIEELLDICIDFHDVGKINEEFQKRIRNHTKFDNETEIYHNILSIYLINPSLFEDKEDYYRCLHIVLNHHAYCNPYVVMHDQKDLIDHLLSDFETFNISTKTKRMMKNCISDKKSILTKGFLHKCDYAASAHLPIEFENNFLEDSLNTFKNENHILWNGLQSFCIDNRNENIITVASTGMGKTEASLLWSGNHKLFFFLPLQTTNNAIYLRLKKMIKNDIDNRLGLLHSNNLDIYSSDENTDVLEHYKLSKQFSLAVNVSTIDQLFDFVFKYKGYELKLTTLSYSKIVIDEIQMYDPRLLACLVFGLEILNDFGTKICITTATLSPFIFDLLTKNISFKFGTFTNNAIRHNLKIYDSQLSTDKIIEHYNKHKEDASCKILIVVNSVKKSQEIYDKLKENNIENIHLLHSKFNKQDRTKKENEIIEDGKTENQKTCIWISTQIVEASLDIDFDYLFTELQDLNSLFQRLGRCNRKGKKSSDNYNCFVFTKINQRLVGTVVDETLYNLSKKAIGNFDGKLSETKKLEMINETFTTENMKDSEYYRKYLRTYNELKTIQDYDIDKSKVDLRQIRSYNIIPLRIYEENEEEIQDTLDQLNNKNNTVLNKMKLENKIKNLCISISDYEKNNIYHNLITEICLNKYEKIFVVDCEYNDEIGFRWNKEENEEKFL